MRAILFTVGKNILGSTLHFKSGAANGQKFAVSGLVGELITFGIGDDAFKVVNDIKVGDEVLIDNSIYLAAQCNPRHHGARPQIAWIKGG